MTKKNQMKNIRLLSHDPHCYRWRNSWVRFFECYILNSKFKKLLCNAYFPVKQTIELIVYAVKCLKWKKKVIILKYFLEDWVTAM